MGALALKIMWTAIIFFGVDVGAMKLFDYDDLPYWLTTSMVILAFASMATILISAIIAIWS